MPRLKPSLKIKIPWFSLSLGLSAILHVLIMNLNLNVSPLPSQSLKMPVNPSHQFRQMTKQEIDFLKKIKIHPEEKLQVVHTDEANDDLKIKNIDSKSRFLSKTTQFVLRQTRAENLGKTQEQQKLKQRKSIDFKKIGTLVSSEGVRPLASQNHAQVKGNALVAQKSSSTDFIEDIPLGETTYLNTVEYKFYGFYERVRGSLEQHWGSNLLKQADFLYKKGGRLPASQIAVTSLKVVLNKLGVIESILVQGSSGLKELDAAAIDAFNKAGPFPNPPQGMLVNGKATIEWGFVVRN